MGFTQISARLSRRQIPRPVQFLSLLRKLFSDETFNEHLPLVFVKPFQVASVRPLRFSQWPCTLGDGHGTGNDTERIGSSNQSNCRMLSNTYVDRPAPYRFLHSAGLLRSLTVPSVAYSLTLVTNLLSVDHNPPSKRQQRVMKGDFKGFKRRSGIYELPIRRVCIGASGPEPRRMGAALCRQKQGMLRHRARRQSDAAKTTNTHTPWGYTRNVVNEKISCDRRRENKD